MGKHLIIFVSFKIKKINVNQRAKKVISHSLGLVDFGIGLVYPVLNLSNMHVTFFVGHVNYRRTVVDPAHQL